MGLFLIKKVQILKYKIGDIVTLKSCDVLYVVNQVISYNELEIINSRHVLKVNIAVLKED